MHSARWRQCRRSVFEHPDAAASVHANARDVAKWLQFLLGDGTDVPSKAASSPRPTSPRRTRRRWSSGSKAWRRTSFSGNQPDELRPGVGRPRLPRRIGGSVHGGIIDGVRLQLTMVPKKKIGIAILCNLHRTATVTQALTNKLLDLLLDASEEAIGTLISGRS